VKLEVVVALTINVESFKINMNSKKTFLVLTFIFLTLLILNFSLASTKTSIKGEIKVQGEVLKSFEKGEKKVGVIIELKEEKSTNKIKGQTQEKGYKNYVYKNVSLKQLNDLEEDEEIEKISISYQIKGFLQDSIEQINASATHLLEISNINLEGTEQTVCILDSGADFTHPDLIGKNKGCVVDCFNKACVENCSIGDDSGHGTHVAGIVGASGGITGVAPNTSLIAVKVLDSNGDGSGNALDLSNAIDYCVTQNSTVISMSLGTSSLYSANCDGLVSAWTDAINDAFAQNISVVIATGNAGSSTQIAAPACISNATPVGSIRKDDLTLDYNRNALLQLLGVGYQINSTKVDGGYVSYSGTSMAAPHVAGAVAVINQVLNLTTQTRTPSQIESLLNSTGKQIYDSSSSLYFSRINIYDAVLSLDNIVPNITLNYPTDSLINLTQNQTFDCNYGDWQLSNATFYLWNSTGLYYNETKDSKGSQNSSNFNITNLPYDEYKWNCLVYDNKSNSAFAENNFTLTIGGISISLDSPENNTYTNKEINFTCNLSSINYDLINATFYLWNSTGLYYNETSEISGLNNQSTFNYNLSTETDYLWNCLAFNNQSNSSWANANYTITYDITSPNSSAVSSSVTSTTSTITWTTNENTNSSINYGTDSSLGTLSNNSTLTTNHSVSLSSLSSSTVYYYNITPCDKAGNCNITGPYDFTTSAAESSSGVTSSGGGGSSSTSMTYKLNQEQITTGYTSKPLEKNDRIKFTFFDKNTSEHTLTINNLNSNSIDLTIQSDPIKLKLGIGQSAKLNLTSPTHYDLYIKLNSIISGKAELVIQTINEKIINQEIKITGSAVEEEQEEPTQSENNDLIHKIKNLKTIIYALVIIILKVIMILLTRWKEIKKPVFGGKKPKQGLLKHLLDIK